jgi:predicted transcriptional regulator
VCVQIASTPHPKAQAGWNIGDYLPLFAVVTVSNIRSADHPDAVKAARNSRNSVINSLKRAHDDDYNSSIDHLQTGYPVTSDNNMVLRDSVTAIAAAYVANNTIPKENLAALITDIFQSLARTGQKTAPIEELKPAVPIKRSVQPDHIICLEDGKTFKSLKRHLMSHYNMTPQAYREKWGLPQDYPMVAPNYAQTRSELAKRIGLGQRKGASIEIAPKVAAPSGKKAPAAKKTPARKSAAA